MNTTFEKGNLVRANVTAQGMTAGNLYVVDAAIRQETPFGTFVTYIIENGTDTLRIGNGHMLLTLMAR